MEDVFDHTTLNQHVGTPLKVIVMGGSLGGLYTAICLKQLGYQISIFERSSTSLIGKGAGIVLNPHIMSYLRKKDPHLLERISIPSCHFNYIQHPPAPDIRISVSHSLTSYTSLYTTLLHIFGSTSYHLNRHITHIEQSQNAVTLRTADGETHSCDLLVCADGAGSDARNFLQNKGAPKYAGYIAWRGVVKANLLTPDIRQNFDKSPSYHLQSDSHALSYPIPMDEIVDGKSITTTYVNWLWYRNVSEGPLLTSLMTDTHDALRSRSVPAGFVQERHIKKMKLDANSLAQSFCKLIHLTDNPFIQPIWDIDTDKMAYGRVCVLGDAAFTFRPHIVCGTEKAMDDSLHLKACLLKSEGDIIGALLEWEKRQIRLGRDILKRGVELGQLLQSGKWPVGTPLPFGIYTKCRSLHDVKDRLEPCNSREPFRRYVAVPPTTSTSIKRYT